MMHSLWRSALLFGALASAHLALVGCRAPEPPPPPFRIAAYGAGLDVARHGAVVTLHDDGAAIGRVRVASHSLRAQRPDATPIGRVRVTSDGWAFIRRDGSSRCYAPDHAHGDDAVAVCEDVGLWTAVPYASHVTVRTPSGVLTRLSLHDDLVVIHAAGHAWTPAARALLHHAFAQPDETSDDVAALILLSWLLKDHASTEEEAPALTYGPSPASDALPDDAPLDADTARTLPSGASDEAPIDDDATPP